MNSDFDIPINIQNCKILRVIADLWGMDNGYGQMYSLFQLSTFVLQPERCFYLAYRNPNFFLAIQTQ